MRSERIQIGEDYYVLASALAPRRPKVFLSQGPGFAIFDHAGDVPLAGTDPFGLFHHGTRFLDRWELRIDGDFPVLLSSAPTADGAQLVTWVSNTDRRHDGEVVLERDALAVQRRKALCGGVLYERLDVRSFVPRPVTVTLSILFAADFADEFEVRGVERARRGTVEPPRLSPSEVRFDYEGLDGVSRGTRIVFARTPTVLDERTARFVLSLPPKGATTLRATIACRVGDAEPVPGTLMTAVGALRKRRDAWLGQYPALTSSNEAFDAWVTRSLRDLAQLRTDGPPGAYVKAGIPWFATVFGRDGLVTALETLVFAPELAADVLRTLAALQGREHRPERDEEPGKIVHELREGEMAATGEVPFGRYYGTVDATPLFLVLLADYAARTADDALVEELWPAALAAVEWVEHQLREGEGYLTYARRNPRGLVHQGWKDSHDAVSHEDGTLAEPPIALAEVQAYVYRALVGLAGLARQTDRFEMASRWDHQAEDLRARFARDFWLEDQDTFALALDRDRSPCRVVSSNAGQCLFGGIASPEHAARLAARLLRDDVFCGWGLRTLSDHALRFNPMSYHNGSVWPHDNALIAAGMARYGRTADAAVVLSGLYGASTAFDDQRLPELFCGFSRTARGKPVPYPVACMPQAWAAGSVLLLIQSVLGLVVDARRRRVTLRRPLLPSWLQRLEVRGLRIGDASVDLRIHRGRPGAAVEVLGRSGEVDVVVGP